MQYQNEERTLFSLTLSENSYLHQAEFEDIDKPTVSMPLVLIIDAYHSVS